MDDDHTRRLATFASSLTFDGIPGAVVEHVKLCPTLAISHLTPDQATSPWEERWVERQSLVPDLCRWAEDAVEEHRRWFRQALAAGREQAVARIRLAACLQGRLHWPDRRFADRLAERAEA